MNYKFLIVLICFPAVMNAESAGKVFRDFTFIPKAGFIDELDPNHTWEFPDDHWSKRYPRHRPKDLEIELEGAERAEFIVEYWGGHVGTAGQQVSVNESPWMDLPQPEGTPGEPQCYYRTVLGNNSLELPLDSLKDGVNTFRFAAGSQICHDFGYGFYWIYSFTVRIHYSQQLSLPDVQIKLINKGKNSTLVEAEIVDPPRKIAQVDFIGEYHDFDWDGNGIWREWQHRTRYGKLDHHIGTRTKKPWKVSWDTRWIPDQDQPIRIKAIVTDIEGNRFETEPITETFPERSGKSILSFVSDDVPEKFDARDVRRKHCSIKIPTDLDLSKVKQARLIVSCWSASTESKSTHELLFNGWSIGNRFGVYGDYSLHTFKIDPDHLRLSKNFLEIYSDYIGHALEVNWPGPMLLLEIED